MLHSWCHLNSFIIYQGKWWTILSRVIVNTPGYEPCLLVTTTSSKASLTSLSHFSLMTAVIWILCREPYVHALDNVVDFSTTAASINGLVCIDHPTCYHQVTVQHMQTSLEPCSEVFGCISQHGLDLPGLTWLLSNVRFTTLSVICFKHVLITYWSSCISRN